jgi:hypothetical protein
LNKPTSERGGNRNGSGNHKMGKCRFEFQITLNRNGSGNSPIFNQVGKRKIMMK